MVDGGKNAWFGCCDMKLFMHSKWSDVDMCLRNTEKFFLFTLYQPPVLVNYLIWDTWISLGFYLALQHTKQLKRSLCLLYKGCANLLFSIPTTSNLSQVCRKYYHYSVFASYSSCYLSLQQLCLLREEVEGLFPRLFGIRIEDTRLTCLIDSQVIFPLLSNQERLFNPKMNRQFTGYSDNLFCPKRIPWVKLVWHMGSWKHTYGMAMESVIRILAGKQSYIQPCTSAKWMGIQPFVGRFLSRRSYVW